MTEAASAPRKRVLVSGCYDLLHTGHVAFFEAASKLGDLYVIALMCRYVYLPFRRSSLVSHLFLSLDTYRLVMIAILKS